MVTLPAFTNSIGRRQHYKYQTHRSQTLRTRQSHLHDAGRVHTRDADAPEHGAVRLMEHRPLRHHFLAPRQSE